MDVFDFLAKEYYESYIESVIEKLWDSVGREPTQQEIDEKFNARDFENYIDALGEAYHENH